jgi:hypothetical protein
MVPPSTSSGLAVSQHGGVSGCRSHPCQPVGKTSLLAPIRVLGFNLEHLELCDHHRASHCDEVCGQKQVRLLSAPKI